MISLKMFFENNHCKVVEILYGGTDKKLTRKFWYSMTVKNIKVHKKIVNIAWHDSWSGHVHKYQTHFWSFVEIDPC